SSRPSLNTCVYVSAVRLHLRRHQRDRDGDPVMVGGDGQASPVMGASAGACVPPHAVTTVLTKSPQFPRPAREVFRCSRARPRNAVVSIAAARSRSLTPAPNRALRPLSSLSRRSLPEDFAISLKPPADGAAPRNPRGP